MEERILLRQGISGNKLIFLALIGSFFAHIASAAELSVVDKLGRKVSLKVPVKRAIVIISYELIPALNIWDQVIGVSRWAEKECDLFKAIISLNPALKKAEVGEGTSINIEAILKLRPDVVITWTYEAEVIRFLEKKGIKVIGIYPDSLPELYKVIRMFGKIFGKEKRAEEVIKQMEDIFHLIRENVSAIKKRKKVIHLGSRPTRVSCAIGVTNDMINLIGAINPAGSIKERYADVSIEKIIEWNPDYIFIWGNAGYTENWLYKNSQWRFITAIKNRCVYKLPEWSTWSPRLAIISLLMAVKVYPEAFRHIDFEKIADRFYKNVFGISYQKVKAYETRY